MQKLWRSPLLSKPYNSRRCFSLLSNLSEALSSIFPAATNYKQFEKSGRAVIIRPPSSPTSQISLEVSNDYRVTYDANSEIIVRNYGSSLTAPDMATLNAAKPVVESMGKGERDFILGRSFAGKIEFIPENMKGKTRDLQVGDRVFGMSKVAAGGAFADYMAIRPEYVRKKFAFFFS